MASSRSTVLHIHCARLPSLLKLALCFPNSTLLLIPMQEPTVHTECPLLLIGLVKSKPVLQDLVPRSLLV